MPIDFSEVKAAPLSKIYDFSNFDCGDKDINDFLKNDALTYQEKKLASTTIFIYKDEIVGFFSAAADSIKLRPNEKDEAGFGGKKIHEFPAIKIARLGRDLKFAKQGTGTNILKYAIGHALSCSEMVAARFVTVDAYPSKADWYKQFGFTENLDGRYKKDMHVSMRYNLFNGIPK